jgi:hypothetical protein
MSYHIKSGFTKTATRQYMPLVMLIAPHFKLREIRDLIKEGPCSCI